MKSLLKNAALLVTGTGTTAAAATYAHPKLISAIQASYEPGVYTWGLATLGLGLIASYAATNLIKQQSGKNWSGVPKNIALASLYGGSLVAAAKVTPLVKAAILKASVPDATAMGGALVASALTATIAGGMLCYRKNFRAGFRRHENSCDNG